MSFTYLFRVTGTDWVKFGSTDCSNPWKRARRGFWSNSHPPAVCRKLGYDDLELLAWARGSTRQAEEAAQKELRAAKADGHGEFWPIERVEEIRAKMKAIAVGAGAPEDSWELPPIPKPAQPPDGTPRLLEKLGCCTGQPKLQCPHCPYQAARQHHMDQHLAESCPGLGKTNKTECIHCGSRVNKRMLSQHQQTAKCKRARNE